MITFFQKLWLNISNIGVDRVTDDFKKRNVIFTNRLVFITFLILLFLFFFNLNKSGWTPFTKSLLVGNFAAIILIYSLNKFGFSILGRILLCLMTSIYPFYTSIDIKIQDPAGIEEAMYFMPRIFIMTTSIIPILIFSSKEKLGLGIALLGSFIPLVFFDEIHELLNVGYFQMGFHANIYSTFYAVTLSSYVIFITSTVFFKQTNEQYEVKNLQLINSLEQSNQKLAIKNFEIEKQSHELEMANNEIRVMNSNLEKVVNNRTKKIFDQASQFQKFSFKNSHELRAPLTNVMVVIQLLKQADSEEEVKQLLDILNTSCSNLDKVVHEINDLLTVSIKK